jgi:glyoxalase/bleomycin resistance protein/dioxygenase superfamily protein
MNVAPFANKYGLTFHHLGLAVQKPDAAQAFLVNLGYQIGTMIHDPVQNVHLALCDHPIMPAVEIICPAEGKGPLDRYLRQHKDGLVYHMGFAAADLTGSIAALKAEEVLQAIFWAEPQEAVLFQGRKIVFCIVRGLGLIELVAERL